MKISTMQVSQPVVLAQFYRDFSSPESAKYQVDLGTEAPALQKQIESLGQEDRQRFANTFVNTWNSLHPDTRQAILGGAAGGGIGAGLALTTLGIKEISRLIGGPVGFAVGVTVLGVVGGALTPKALSHFSNSSVKANIKTPALWNVVLPEATLEFQGKASQAPAAAKPPRPNSQSKNSDQ